MALLAEIAAVGVGGTLGGVARHWVNGIVTRWVRTRFPWGILVVNVSGALCIGLLMGAAEGIPALANSTVWSLAATGVLGSYTTVSSFSLQTLELVRSRDIVRAGANVGLSFGFCLGGAGVGLSVARWLAGA